jgi:hypothetical protein
MSLVTFAKPMTSPGRVADRVDDDGRPEPAAVFTHAPAFRLEFSFACGGFKGSHRHSGCLVFNRIKPAEMLAHNLTRSVALDAFGAGIPARDDSVGIELKDRVIDDRIDQQLREGSIPLLWCLVTNHPTNPFCVAKNRTRGSLQKVPFVAKLAETLTNVRGAASSTRTPLARTVRREGCAKRYLQIAQLKRLSEDGDAL